MQAAAEQAGLSYHFIPLGRDGVSPQLVDAETEALEGSAGPVLAFCRSGTRSAFAVALAKREEGASAEEVSNCLVSAGFDPGPIAHLL